MAKLFQSEREGQIKFFEDLRIANEVELSNNTDGVYKGTLFEFKLNISDINKTLFQSIKYLSHLRVKGESIPKNILLVSLNTEIAYLFNSELFLNEIEQIYTGAASKNNDKFDTKIEAEKIKYDNIEGLQKLLEIFNSENFTKIHIDVFCVIGWANRYYRENPTASKIKMFTELRNPEYFKNLIYAWSGDEQDFKYIMDCLNDKMHKTALGAFYTPSPYCKKAAMLVRKAIAQIPKENNYIILDRCAGTGNLEEFLTDKPVSEITINELDNYLPEDIIRKYLQDKNGILKLIKFDNFNNITMGELEEHKTSVSIYDYLFDNEISHVIVNTYELKEWVVLNERIGDKVKMIIPPPIEVKNTDSLVNGGDALSQEFIIAQKSTAFYNLTDEYFSAVSELNSHVKNSKVNIILFENPPFRDDTSNSHTKSSAKESYAKTMMKEHIKGPIVNDLSNQFIWTAWEYYLQKPNDCYVLFSPIKYWKSCALSDKRFIEGYIFNRHYFHASSRQAITCILWKNEFEKRESLKLGVIDIVKDPLGNDITSDIIQEIYVKRVYENLSKLYDKRADNTDLDNGIVCSLDGQEDENKKSRVIKKYNENIIGYLVAQQFGFENPRLSTNLTRCAIYNGNGFFLRQDNFIEKLPLFAVGKFPIEKKWQQNGIIFKTSDGGTKYSEDSDFLKSCFIFTCLSYFNKCRSLDGSDGRFYKNELCFDNETIASEKLKEFHLTENEKELLNTFEDILKLAQTTKNYNPKFTYGTYQIDQELNTNYKDETKMTIYDYPELNTKIIALKTKLIKYYEDSIQSKLFKYELLK